jgi:hypothetical protein
MLLDESCIAGIILDEQHANGWALLSAL